MVTGAAAKTDENILARKMGIYMFLAKFYSGKLLKMDLEMWHKFGAMLREEVASFDNERMKKGIVSMLQDSRVLEELEYEFNRLFVGPDRLEAAPYESVYRSAERVLMQAETMAVRKFYERAGLTLINKNREPDDHLAFELEFACYLLEKSLQDNGYAELYEAFLKLHLFQWVEKHCELVREKTANSLITGISNILQGLMEVEQEHMNKMGRS